MRLGLIGTLLISFVFWAPASAVAPMSDCVPRDALVYVGWAGRSLVFDGSAMGQLVQERSVGKIAGALSTLVTDRLEQTQAELFSHLWSMAGICWQHPVGVSVLDFAADSVNVLVVVDLGSDLESFQRELALLLQKLPDQFDVSEKSVGPDRLRVLRGGPAGLEEISFGFKERVFFLATNLAVAESFASLTRQASLQMVDNFRKCWQDVAGPNEQIAIYVDVRRILERLDGVTSPRTGDQNPDSRPVSAVKKIADALGLGKCEALACSARIVDRGFHTKMKLFSPAPHRGLLMPLAGAPLSEDDLATVPADADFFLAMKGSPDVLWAELRHSLEMLDPDMAKALDGKVGELERSTGMSVARDLIANLGDTLVIAGAPSQGGFLTGTVLTLPIRDSDKLLDAFAKIEDYSRSQSDGATGIVIRKYLAERAEISYLTIGNGQSPMAPAWAIHEGRLYVAGWPQIIASVIGRDTAATTITADPCYRKTRSRLHESASILSYVNSPQIARHLYGSALLGWTLGAGMLENQSNIEAGIDWLPSLATLEKYLWVDTTTVSSDARGVTFSSYGSLPMIGLSAVPFGGPVLLAGPAIALQRAKANARKALSQTKLKSIHLAIMLYADDHEGSLPPDLAALGDKYLQSTETFVSPLSDRPPPRLVDGKFGSQIDYIWVGSGNLWSYDKPQEVVLAYERPENYNGKPTLVLFADGQIAFMDAPSLAKALSLSKELTGDH